MRKKGFSLDGNVDTHFEVNQECGEEELYNIKCRSSLF